MKDFSNCILNYRRITEQVQFTAHACGRSSQEIEIVVVSKGHPWKEIAPLYEEGVRAFGENRVQEWLPKASEAPKDVAWHYIGALQTNKVSKVVGAVDLIHSVHHPKLAWKISEESLKKEIVTHCLLQVNTSEEPSKQGLTMEEWQGALLPLLQLPGIRIEGFMTMAPFTEERAVIRNCFARLRLFREACVQRVHGEWLFPVLSMGMSHDFLIAIEEGATLLRIGSAIFQPIENKC